MIGTGDFQNCYLSLLKMITKDNKIDINNRPSQKENQTILFVSLFCDASQNSATALHRCGCFVVVAANAVETIAFVVALAFSSCHRKRGVMRSQRSVR